MPTNAFMFGLVILDWDGSFQKRLRKYSSVADLKIPFQYIEEIPPWQKAANWTEVGDIIGRFEPMNVYANSGPMEIQLKLIYLAEAKTSVDSASPWTLEYIETLTKRFQSLVYPAYDGQYSPPPKLLLNIGNVWRDIPVVVKQCAVTNEAPYDIGTLLSHKRTITLDCRISYPTWQGMSNTRIYAAYEGGGGRYGPDVFAYETLDQKFKPVSMRSRSNSARGGAFKMRSRSNSARGGAYN